MRVPVYVSLAGKTSATNSKEELSKWQLADLFVIKTTPEDHPGADNENKFSFHVSVSFCG